MNCEYQSQSQIAPSETPMGSATKWYMLNSSTRTFTVTVTIPSAAIRAVARNCKKRSQRDFRTESLSRKVHKLCPVNTPTSVTAVATRVVISSRTSPCSKKRMVALVSLGGKNQNKGESYMRKRTAWYSR
ncbi:MAG: hypothetical protein A2Y76_11830 [Planctomycetes bacterium RBG_13_60_9]|nr:MAG: hypothetical protein A2Y76_11830 [Planctomycetes bacterium RBG_13_60_9]